MLKMLCFIFVCLLGLFVGLAGGMEWGEPHTGILAFMTFLVAGLCSTLEIYK